MAAIEWQEGTTLVQVYSKIDGSTLEVPSYIFSDLEDFEASTRGQVFANYSSKPVEWNRTHVGMMQIGASAERMKAEEAASAARTRAEAEAKKLVAPPQDVRPSHAWSDLTAG
jgi:hypothetical protein